MLAEQGVGGGRQAGSAWADVLLPEEAARFAPSERRTEAGGGGRRRAGPNPSRRASALASRPSVGGRMRGGGCFDAGRPTCGFYEQGIRTNTSENVHI